ncbi:MAG: transposase [Gammaproteobacteria bacterium]|nr:transposase [Gammaproteobacteria bacterium]
MLTLRVAYEGMAIPLFWDLLPKAGNASAEEHQSILERFIKHFDSTKIVGVLADREFGSAALFQWFNQHKIPFYIRIKEDSIVRVGNKKLCKAEKYFVM